MGYGDTAISKPRLVMSETSILKLLRLLVQRPLFVPAVEAFPSKRRRRLGNSARRRPLSAAGLLACRGDFCIVPIPFTDLSMEKTRPVLVAAAEPRDLTIVPVAGRTPRREFEVFLQFWRESGMHAPGSVRSSRLCAIERPLLREVIGHVLPEDWERILAGLKEWFNKFLAAADTLDLESLLLADEASRAAGSPRHERPLRRLKAYRSAPGDHTLNPNPHLI